MWILIMSRQNSANLVVEHEGEIVSESSHSVDPHDNGCLEYGHPQNPKAPSVSVHYVKDILARRGHARKAEKKPVMQTYTNAIFWNRMSELLYISSTNLRR